MALSTYAGSFEIAATATGYIDVSAPGFQPTAIIFWWTGANGTGDTHEYGNHYIGEGFATSATNRASKASYHQDNVGTTNSAEAWTNANCIITCDDSSVTGLGDLDVVGNWPANGFRLLIDDQFPVNLRVSYLALGGSDLTNATCGWFLAPTATGTQNITGLGFDADACVFSAQMLSTAPPQGPVAHAHNTMSFGWYDNPTSYGYSVASFFRDADSTSLAESYNYGPECVAAMALQGNSDPYQRGYFNGPVSGGFQINWLDVSGTQRYVMYMALAGAEFYIDEFSTTTGTGTIARTGYGDTPGALLVISACRAESTQDTKDNNVRISIGAASSATQRTVQGWTIPHGVSTPRLTRHLEHDEVWMHPVDDQGDIQTGTCDYVSVISAGSWTNLANVASNDSNFATANPPESVTGTVNIDDAPADYDGAGLYQCSFEVNWRVQGTGTQKRSKFITLNWRKADTTLIHSYTTPLVDGTTERTDTQTFVTPTGTASLTDTEWDNSYVEIIGDEEGGGPDDYYDEVDYFKLVVKYYDDTGGVQTEGLMDIQSFDSDGVTFIMDEADSSPSRVGVFAIIPVAGAPTPKSLNATAVGTATLNRLVTRYRTLPASATGLATILQLRTLSKLLSASAAGGATVLRESTRYRTLSATATGTATLTKARFFERLLDATASAAATILREATHLRTLSTTATGTASLQRALTLSELLSATATGTPSFLKLVTKTLQATAVGSASLDSAKIYFQNVIASATGTATILKTKTLNKLLSAVAAGTATINQLKTFYRTLSVSGVGAGTIDREATHSRTLSTTAVGTADVSWVTTFARTLSASAVGSPYLNAEELTGDITYKTLPATAVGSATILRSITRNRTLQATAVGTASIDLEKTLSQLLSATAIGLASLDSMSLFYRTLSATAIGTAALDTETTHSATLSATATGTATLTRQLTWTKTLAATAVGTASIGQYRELSQLLSVTVTAIPSLQAGTLQTVLMSATAVGTAAINTVKIVPVAALQMFQTVIPEMIGRIFRGDR